MGVVIVLILLAIGYLFYQNWLRYTTPHGAPYVPLAPDVVARIIKMAKVGEKDRLYDLGSGDGRVVIAAAMLGANAIGIEKDWLRVWYSRIWIKLLRLEKHAKITHGDIFKQNYSDATVVCTYLLQETNDKLEKKLEKELKKGTRIVSSAFTYKNWKLKAKNWHGTPYGPLYFYKI